MDVFDFDKTLTNQDTLFGFYQEVGKADYTFWLKRVVLILFALLYKGKVISNDQLKKVGVLLFLKNKSQQQIAVDAASYVQKLVLNDIYYNVFLSTPRQQRLIVSASLEEYLSSMFPTEKVIGSSLSYKLGKVKGLQQNMYGAQKAKALQSIGIKSIGKLYTDSFSDSPLMEMAEQVFLVKNAKVVKEWHPNLKK